jgi:peptidylamidoglycolate lyase
MKRKHFIRQSSFAATAMFLSPSILKSSKMEDIILGQGNKRYRINTKWSKADAMQYPVKDCHEMIQDKKGRILLLTNETKNNVLIYDRSGKLLSYWGTEYPGACTR